MVMKRIQLGRFEQESLSPMRAKVTRHRSWALVSPVAFVSSLVTTVFGLRACYRGGQAESHRRQTAFCSPVRLLDVRHLWTERRGRIRVQNLCCVQERAVPVQRTVLTELAAADFRHPLDALATQQIDLIMRLTGMVTLVRRVIGPMAEQILEIENISTGVLVGPEQMPSLYALLTEACEILHIDVPDLYIRQNPIPNAYTLAINGQRPFIVLHSALLDMGLSAAELQTVIAHELGHLKCEHGIWITMANLLLLALGQLGELGRSLATVLGRRLFSWLQAAELSCDRAALLVMQDPRLVIGVLMKLSGGSATWASEMNPDAFLRQAVRLEAVSRTRLGRQVRQQMQRGATHPLPVVRARELDRWAHSVEYQRILARGRLAVAHSSERRPSLRREETLESSARNAN